NKKGGEISLTNGSHNENTRKTEEEKRKTKLVETIKRKSETQWNQFKLETQSLRQRYSKVAQKNSSGSKDTTELDHKTTRHEHESSGGSEQSTRGGTTSKTVTFRFNTKVKHSVPVLEGTVVTGDGDIS